MPRSVARHSAATSSAPRTCSPRSDASADTPRHYSRRLAIAGRGNAQPRQSETTTWVNPRMRISDRSRACLSGSCSRVDAGVSTGRTPRARIGRVGAVGRSTRRAAALPWRSSSRARLGEDASWSSPAGADRVSARVPSSRGSETLGGFGSAGRCAGHSRADSGLQNGLGDLPRLQGLVVDRDTA
jgi:hypothetical protein